MNISVCNPSNSLVISHPHNLVLGMKIDINHIGCKQRYVFHNCEKKYRLLFFFDNISQGPNI